MHFTATFFDGFTTKAKQVEVTLHAWGLSLEPAIGEAYFEKIVWELNLIQSDGFNSHLVTKLYFGESQPYQSLECSNPLFYEALLLHYPGAKFNTNVYQFSLKNTSTLAGIFLVFIVLCASIYFYAIPLISGGLAATFPIKWEEQIGDKLYESLKNEEDIAIEKSKKLQQFYDELHFKTDYNIQTVYAESNVVNAFAMPGGHIVLYAGLFDKMDNYKELAGLLGHEFSHIELRHSTKDIFRTLSSYILLSLLFGDASGVVGAVAENADMIKRMAYSRSFELEADDNAYVLLQEQKINTQGLISLFEKLKQEEAASGIELPEFASSHPVTDDRITHINNKINNDQTVYQPQPKLEQLFIELKQLDQAKTDTTDSIN